MSIFRNDNESAYVGGRKHWTDVIKNSGPGGALVWRQPEEDFNTRSTLIVMPGEEAIFVKGGQVEEVFQEGTYKLSTENYPVVSRLKNMFSGGVSTFNCVVYFVRKASSIELFWGTDSPIQVRDPVHKLMVGVRARGAYKVRVTDGVVFLTTLLGNNINVAAQTDIDAFFASQFLQIIKSNIAKYITSAQQEILGIAAEQDVIAEAITPLLAPVIAEYGLELLNFSVMGIDIPEDDPNRMLLEDAFAEKARMAVLGEDWNRVEARDLLNNLANNPGAGGAGAMMGGMGMGMAAGSVFGSMAQQMMKPFDNGMNGMQQGGFQGQPGGFQNQQSGRFTQQQRSFQQASQPGMAPQGQAGGAVCTGCGQPLGPGARFCSACGTPAPAPAPQKAFCPNCGTEVAPGAAFCSGCGNKLQ